MRFLTTLSAIAFSATTTVSAFSIPTSSSLPLLANASLAARGDGFNGNCKGSRGCSSFSTNLQDVARAASGHIVLDNIYTTSEGAEKSGVCSMAEERIGFGGLDIHLQMGIFVKAAKGKACEAKGEELMSAYRDITINCGLCGSVPLGDGCEIKKDYVTGCKTKN